MNIKMLAGIMACVLITTVSFAQEEEKEKKKDVNTLEISNNGIKFKSKMGKNNGFGVEFFMLDLGINSIQDKTDYTTAAAQNYMRVPDALQNEQLFTLRNGKSWNVNLWPVIAKWRVVNGGGQKIYIGTGVGLQMYNFRFTKPVTLDNTIEPIAYLDSVNHITKNKVGLTYLSVPLMFTFKTKAAEKAWLVYGVGVSGGYRLSSWTKQISDERGKQKNHDQFNFNDFNACLTAEVGIDNIFRLYASYQMTPLHENALEQYPFSIGIRFGGI